MSILITGFEPFDCADRNPSWEAVRLLPDTILGQTLHHLQLPVEFTRAATILRENIAALHPDLVIACGVAGGRTAITPELVAINYRHARIPDNAGQQYQAQPIDPDGPAAYMTSLPIHRMIDAVNAAGIPARLSLSAGAYVCNDLYYALLASENEFRCRGIFIHVPTADVLDAPTAARAIAICIETALEA